LFDEVEPKSLESNVWDYVSRSPLRSMWDLQGVPVHVVLKRTWSSILEDNLFGRASQLAYYFFFALFPSLIAASSMMGLAAKSAEHIYVELINRVASLIPPAAFGIVMDTFNQTTKASSKGKLALGIFTALWSASVGVSAIQDTLNAVYKVKETRSYWRARGEAILLTLGAGLVLTVALAALLGASVGAKLVRNKFAGALIVSIATQTAGWIVASALMVLVLALLYFFSPDLQKRRWRWFTPGSAIGLFGWVLGSLSLRLYLHWFDSYSVTYGSLGAVIILLTWFYVTGLMLLLGAEVNSEIEAAVAEKKIMEEKTSGGTVVPLPED
jgi:membrane protein